MKPLLTIKPSVAGTVSAALWSCVQVVTVMLALALFAMPGPAQANTCTSNSVGTSWNDNSHWSGCGGSRPQTGDTVIIATATTLDRDPDPIASLTVNTGQTFTIGNDSNGRTLPVTGNVTVTGTGSIIAGATATTHVLEIGGNLSNAGTFDGLPGAGRIINVTFNGTGNQTVSGAGATTRFNRITVNNSGAIGSDIVEITTSNFTAAAGFLTLTNGDFKISGSFTFTNTFFNTAGYTIGAGNELWINNPNVTVTAQGGAGADAILSGTLRITSGTYNVGTANAEALEYNSGATLQIEGGALNLASTFRGTSAAQTLTFNMSGGTLTVNTASNTSTRPSFAIEAAGSSFTMSGGTIIFEDANLDVGGDYQNIAGTVNITGGTVQFGNASTSVNSNFNLGESGTNILPSLSIVDNATSVPIVTCGAAIDVSGNVTINSGTTLAANGQAINVSGNSASNPGTWTNNGTFTSGTQTTTFDGSTGIQTINGSTSSAFSSLTIANTGSGSTDMVTSGSVVATLTLTSNLTVTSPAVLTATGSTSTGNADVVGSVTRTDNNGTARSFGNVNVQITRTAGTDATFTVIYDNQAPTDFGNAVRRTYTLTPGAAITATVRLRYLDNATELNGNAEGTLQLWRKNGAWAAQGGTPDSVNNYVTLTGVTTFSPWAIAGPTAPTAVKLTRFNATSYADGVALSWESGFEVNNLGYHIYREQGGKRTRVTPSVIAGSALTVGPGSSLTAGFSYSWFDPKGTANTTYYLEDIDLNGERTMAGPIWAANKGGGSPKNKRALLLSELAETASSAQPMEQSWPTALSETARAEKLKFNAESFAVQQTIAAGEAVKLQVHRTGWYRVSQAELLSAGLDSGVDTRLLQLYVDGEEVPIRLSTDSGPLRANDTLEFYGVALDTATTDTRTYWLVKGQTPGKRISSPKRGKRQPSDLIWTDASSGLRNFSQTSERREKLIYFSNLLNGETENIFGPLVSIEPTTQVISVQNMDSDAGVQPQVEVALQGITLTGHQVQVALNGTVLGTINFGEQQHPVERFTVDRTLVGDGDNAISLVSTGAESDVSFVDWVRLTYPRRFIAHNNALSFSVPGGQAVRIGGFTSPNIRVIDITDPNTVMELPTVAGPFGTGYGVKVQTRGTQTRSFLAFADDLAQRPASITANQPSSWNAPTNGADMVIITHKDFRQALEPLASLRRNQGLSVAVIDVEDIYDEFTYGAHTPLAIKGFLMWAASVWHRKPQFLLLAGDSSWDPRNYTGEGANDFVPTKLLDATFMETASDDWLADFDGDGLADMAVGRLPGRSAVQISLMVAKILNYEAEREVGGPLRGALLVADSGFGSQSAQTQALLPPDMSVETISRDDVNNDDIMRGQIVNSLNQGPLIVNYFGHGSVQVWTGAGLLDNDLASSLANGNRLSLFVMMTCLNGYAHDAYTDSLAEAALKAENGGAVAVWASSGFTEPLPQFALDSEFYRQLFGNEPLRLGEAVRNAKLAVSDVDVRRTWILLGDPALKIR